jgi:signal transduction histidine kinase
LSATSNRGNEDQQDALERLRRVYSFLNSTHEAIACIKEPEPLFGEACRIAVEAGGFRMAWIGLVDGETGQIRPVAHRGFEDGYLEKISVSANGSDSRGRGPTGIAVREGSISICNDFETDPRMEPWRKEALKRGYKSSGAFPLRSGDRVIGALMLYAPEKYWFASEEVELFKSLAENISLAVGAMEKEAELRDYREHLEDLVEERTRHLQLLNDELESFTYSVSHDLRSPLRAIDGFSHMLLSDLGDALDDAGRESFDFIFSSVRRMDDTIDGLLRLARAGRQEIEVSRVDMAALAGSVLEELRPFREERDVEFLIGELPDADCDPALMRQVLSNLLSNALKFTRGEERAVVEVRAETREGETMYLVRDNGAGFDEKHADRLFKVFQRLHSEQQFEGTGVGLALVDKIIARHGGRVWAEGKPGEGATLYFTLPAGAAPTLLNE